jgi:ribosomal protein S18 acetylase RimI-like enzyme
MNITFREGTNQDKDKLKELGLKSYGQFKSELTEDNWEKMNSYLSTVNSYADLLNGSKCFVCEVDEQIVGMAYLVSKGNPTDIFDKDWCYIRMVGVDPKYSGNGIGKKLTQMCIDFAKTNNEDVIALHTSEFMNKARHIYEKMGFKAVKELPQRYGKKYWLYLFDIKNTAIMITYQIEKSISVDEFREVLVNSTLGERRPVNNFETLSKMLEHGNLIVTARENGKLIGIARSLTDFDYCTYLSDLAVDEKYQKMGIGKELIKQTKLMTPNAKLILLSAPKAINYYPKIGMTRHEQCFFLDNVNNII